jgi:hypothetical protein
MRLTIQTNAPPAATKGETLAVAARHGLYIDAFGISSKHAIRHLLSEFRSRGWRDPGDAAFLIVHRIETKPGIAPDRAAAAAPSEFYDLNDIKRADVAEMLAGVARRKS